MQSQMHSQMQSPQKTNADFEDIEGLERTGAKRSSPNVGVDQSMNHEEEEEQVSFRGQDIGSKKMFNQKIKCEVSKKRARDQMNKSPGVKMNPQNEVDENDDPNNVFIIRSKDLPQSKNPNPNFSFAQK